MDIILSSVYFGFLYKMRLVQIQMNEKGKQPSEVFKQLELASRMVKFTTAAYLCAGSTYTFFFTILDKTGIYNRVPGLEFTLTIVTLIICVPFDILQVILCIYFIKIGSFITRLLQLENNRVLKLKLVGFFVYTMIAEILCVYWWIYPSIQALTFQACSQSFLAFRPYLIFFFHG